LDSNWRQSHDWSIFSKKTYSGQTDHAFCQQKDASTAISLIVKFIEKSELV